MKVHITMSRPYRINAVAKKAALARISAAGGIVDDNWQDQPRQARG